MDSRLTVLPAIFRENPIFIIGQNYVGSPKQAGTDNNAHVPERSDRPIIYIDCTFNANGAAEALKLARHWKIAVIGGVSFGGVEDVLDINRGGNIEFYQHHFERGPAKQDVTLKGGAHTVGFHSCTGLRLLVLGEYTKYDHHAIYPDGKRRQASPWQLARPAVRNVTVVNCGEPTVRCIHAENPVGNYKLDARFRPYAAPYFWARTFFKETTPAPSEEFIVTARELVAAS